MNEWREMPIAAIATTVAGGPFGSSLGRKDYVDSGVPVIRGAQLSGTSSLRFDDLVFVTEEKADRHLGNLAYPGDVIVTQRGTLGQVAIVPLNSPYPRLLLSQSQMKVTVDPSVADPSYLVYTLSEPENRQRLIQHAVTAGVPHINLATLREFTVKIPSLATQRASAAVLELIDNLIENNRRRMALLEQMAQAIYQEWFVRFRYPGHESADLVDSHIGAVPADWDVIPVAEAVEINPKVRGPRGDEVPFVVMADLSNHLMVVRPSSSRAFGGSGSRFQQHDTLFARITPCTENGKTGFVQFLGDRDVAMGSTEFIVFRARRISAYATYCVTRRDDLRRHAIRSMAGASGRQRVRNESFQNFLIAVCPNELEQRFAVKAEPLFKGCDALAEQNRQLVAMRDVLLPKLVSGAIDVSDIDLDALLDQTAA